MPSIGALTQPSIASAHSSNPSTGVGVSSGGSAESSQASSVVDGGRLVPATWSNTLWVAGAQMLKDAASVLGSSTVVVCMQLGAKAAIEAEGTEPSATLATASIVAGAINMLAAGYMARSLFSTSPATASIVGAAAGLGITMSGITTESAHSAAAGANAAVRMLGTGIYSGLRDVLQGALKPEISDLVGVPAVAQLSPDGTRVEYSSPENHAAQKRLVATTVLYAGLQMGAASLVTDAFPGYSTEQKFWLAAAARTAIEGLDSFLGVMVKRLIHPEQVQVKVSTASWKESVMNLPDNVRNNISGIFRNGAFRAALNSVASSALAWTPDWSHNVHGNPFVANAVTALTEGRGDLVAVANLKERAAAASSASVLAASSAPAAVFSAPVVSSVPPLQGPAVGSVEDSHAHSVMDIKEDSEISAVESRQGSVQLADRGGPKSVVFHLGDVD